MATTIGDLQVLIKGDASSLIAAVTKSVSSLGAVEAATAATVGGFALLTTAAVSAAVDYDRAFTRIETLSNANAEAVAGWRKEVLDLAGATAQAPQELADALFFLSSAGLETSQVMETLELSAKASAVGLGETTDIAKITANALNAYADSGLTAAEVTDTLVAAVREGSAEPEEFAAALGRILPIASKAGVEFEEVTASLAGLSNIGLDVNEGVTAMRGLLAAIVAPTKQTQTAMAELGISTDQLRQVLSEDGLLAAMQLLEERSGGNLDVLKALVPNVRALTGQLGLTGDNAEKVAEIFDNVSNATGSLGEAFATTEQSVGFMLDQLKSGVQASFIEVGEKLLPVLLEILPVITELAETIGGILAEALEQAAQTIRPVTDLFGALGDELAKIGGSSEEAGDSLGGKLLKSIRDQISPTLGLSAAYGEWQGSLDDAKAALLEVNAAITDTAFDDARAALGVIEGMWNDYVTSVNQATDAEKAHADALNLSVSAMREAAGGLLGLIEAGRTYADAQQRVNELERQGKKGTDEYRDAVGDLLTQRLELTAALGELQESWEQQGVSLGEAKRALEQVGRQAGLTGGDLRRFIQEGIAPVRSELGKLKEGSPYKVQVPIVITGMATLSQLESKLQGLEARYDLGLAVDTAMAPSGGGGSTTKRRRREASYLDRERFERDHAYSREYEGWR